MFTEKDWSDCSKGEHINAYSKSKTMAEQAAWDFQKEHAAEHNIEIVTINPGLIMGPSYVGAGFASGDIITNIMMGKWPGMPKTRMGLVDVRDVAQAHLEGIKKPAAANKRFILVENAYWFSKVGDMLHQNWKH